MTAGKHFFTHTACFRGKVPDESVTEPEQGVVVEGASMTVTVVGCATGLYFADSF